MTGPLVVETIDALRSALGDGGPRGGALDGGDVALVPTMGALHEGHLALVDRARELASTVVVSVFVNPLQFGPAEDLAKYPRDLDADLALLAAHGVDLVFAPGVDVMYPQDGSGTRVTGGPVASLYEGRSRPGHFDGVLTVVAKLLNIVRPRYAVFGQKDAQQLFLVQRMVADLNVPVAIVPVETVRESDGLALSSRNRYLSADERRAALVLSRALEAAASAADRGVDSALAAAQSVFSDEDLVKLDYLVVVDPATLLGVPDDYRGPARVLVAARIGATRLIDNDAIYLN